MARATMGVEETLGFQNNFIKEAYEHKWTIPKWSSLDWQQNNLKAELTYTIDTGKPNRLQTKWTVVFIIMREPTKVRYKSYWKMVEMKNFNGEIEAKASLIVRGPGCTKKWVKGEGEFSKAVLNEKLKTARFIIFDRPSTHNTGDEMTMTLKLVLKIPNSSWLSHLQIMSLKKVDRDFLGILQDESTADLKIITGDEKQLFAHKCILKARCPVFESMFRSNFKENSTGIINVEDISGKTMNILLHYFYSGQLLPSWRDEDTVLEFLYAVGKYQLTEVLEILDFDLRVQNYSDELTEQLIDIANKLGLSNAEATLLRSINKRKRKIEEEAELQKTAYLSVCLDRIL